MDIIKDVKWPEGVKEAILNDDVETVKKLMKTADDFLLQFKPKIITVEEFKTLIAKNEKIIIFDLRDTKSFGESSIRGSINVPYGIGLSEKVNSIGNKKIVLTCFAGKLSNVAGDLLNKEGFDNVYVLQGGMMAYNK
ncbi:MAG: molybdopterin biosynthesis-like protein MoeZ [Candidatus Methanofastidiosum methylothiophilum]|uniref:Molybdopterin biosynthesis-like protein MoeZ n=1 Tax=Candidatus Methanofastidiosum methylothiophilum TaxID=1705564 RepID=A0A150J8M1_9EURY|nr:MAG: molybdopterin biosynthesis-like protein MoeZ [Candidatus Methanofastidiosum methylthiophilus]NMC77083.1 rhodanese-like domain-containing protein [Candidatus Methanofastidiosa archaeon]